MIFAEVSEMKVKVSLYGPVAFLLAQSVKKSACNAGDQN